MLCMRSGESLQLQLYVLWSPDAGVAQGNEAGQGREVWQSGAASCSATCMFGRGYCVDDFRRDVRG